MLTKGIKVTCIDSMLPVCQSGVSGESVKNLCFQFLSHTKAAVLLFISFSETNAALTCKVLTMDLYNNKIIIY